MKHLGMLILRLCVGIFLIHHGYEKLDSIENFADAFVRPLHLPFPIFFSYCAALSEIFGSWLLITGFLTRLGALSIVMTASFAIYHAVVFNGFNIYLLELLGLYWGGAAAIMLCGPGKLSLDHLILNSILSSATIPETDVKVKE